MQSKNQDESAKPQLTKEELQELNRKIDAISYRNGFMELLLGIGIVFSTLNLCYRTFGSARLGIIFNNFWLLFFIYFALLAYNRKLICKKIPEARAIDVKRGVESSPFLVTIAPFFLTAVLIWWRMTESGIQIPASLYKIMAMMFAFGCASAITLYVYTLSKNLSWLFWGLITLAYLILYSFEFINIGNYYIFTLPLGIVILISGVLANLRFVRSEIV
jgi:hypothetical protein